MFVTRRVAMSNRAMWLARKSAHISYASTTVNTTAEPSGDQTGRSSYSAAGKVAETTVPASTSSTSMTPRNRNRPAPSCPAPTRPTAAIRRPSGSKTTPGPMGTGIVRPVAGWQRHSEPRAWRMQPSPVERSATRSSLRSGHQPSMLAQRPPMSPTSPVSHWPPDNIALRVDDVDRGQLALVHRIPRLDRDVRARHLTRGSTGRRAMGPRGRRSGPATASGRRGGRRGSTAVDHRRPQPGPAPFARR